MASDFETFLDTTQRAEDPAALNACFYQAIQREGYENLVFVAAGKASPLEVLCAELPPGYVETYLHHDWAAVDPVLLHSRTARQPFAWDAIRGQSASGDREARFFDACESIGVRSGVTMPFHNPDGRTHVMSVSLRGGSRPDPLRIPYIYALAAQTWIRHNALAAGGPARTRVRLTDRERECLLWAKEGKTNWEIGVILSLAERTVEFHVSNAMRKLNASNRVTAIVIALQEGLIAI